MYTAFLKQVDQFGNWWKWSDEQRLAEYKRLQQFTSNKDLGKTLWKNEEDLGESKNPMQAAFERVKLDVHRNNGDSLYFTRSLKRDISDTVRERFYHAIFGLTGYVEQWMAPFSNVILAVSFLRTEKSQHMESDAFWMFASFYFQPGTFANVCKSGFVWIRMGIGLRLPSPSPSASSIR